ncbi:MAG: sulfatase-like hydrolase/transferase [Anaerolineales bacterium]
MNRLRRALVDGYRSYYPVLFAVFSVLSLYQVNVEDVPASDVVRPLLLATILAGLIGWIFRRLIRQSDRAGLLAAGTLFVFFSYGRIFDAIQGGAFAGISLGHHRYLILAMGMAWIAWSIWVGWLLKQPAIYGRAVRVFVSIAVLLPLTSLGYRSVQAMVWRAKSPVDPGVPIQSSQGSSPSELPDIYYLILDGYGRADVLDQYYQVDNSPFIQWLETHDFYIAAGATSNYNQTVLSLASSLNLAYLDDFDEVVGSRPANRAQLADRLKHNQLRAFLQDLGYRVVAFETGYSQTEVSDADYFWAPEAVGGSYPILGGHLTRFESLLLDATVFRAALDLDLLRRQLAAFDPGQSLYQEQRVRIQYTFDSLGRAAAIDGPTLVFAHVIAPHPPFVFGADGQPLRVKGAFSLADADAFGGGAEAYVAGYRDQLKYVNQLTERAIEQIMARSDHPPLILIQGDHGPGAHMVWDSAERSLVEERFSILSAYYFPDHNYGDLYPTISPVNSFRIVLDDFFGANLPLVPDRSYFATWDQPLDFTEVTERVRP